MDQKQIIDKYLEDKLVEWSGKTISSSEHFNDELRRTIAWAVHFGISLVTFNNDRQ